MSAMPDPVEVKVPSEVRTAIIGALVGAACWIIRIITAGEKYPFWVKVRKATTAGFVGSVANLAGQSYFNSVAIGGAICGVAGYLSQELVEMALRKIKKI